MTPDGDALDAATSAGPALTSASAAALDRAVAVLGEAGPLPLVVATDPYARLLDNWICHVEALGIGRYLIVALDDALAQRLARAGIVSARCDWNGTYPDFVLQRALVWEYLCRRGVDFIQTDMDAVWLHDPVPAFFARSRFDVLISEGTFHPVDILARRGFVLCTGFFHARPTAATQAWLSELRGRGDQIAATDCQYVMNHVFDELGTVWHDAELPRHRLIFRGHEFTVYDEILEGRCDALGLSVGMLPHRLFQRDTDLEYAFVKHVQRTKDPTRRIDAMRAAGCWMLDEMTGRLGAPPGPFE